MFQNKIHLCNTFDSVNKSFIIVLFLSVFIGQRNSFEKLYVLLKRNSKLGMYTIKMMFDA